MSGIEPPTNTLRKCCSTTELHRHVCTSWRAIKIAINDFSTLSLRFIFRQNLKFLSALPLAKENYRFYLERRNRKRMETSTSVDCRNPPADFDVERVTGIGPVSQPWSILRICYGARYQNRTGASTLGRSRTATVLISQMLRRMAQKVTLAHP